MGAAAKYTLDIKDITDVGTIVDMTVKLDKYIAYSYQAATAVQNELVSEVTIPAYYSASGAIVSATPSTTVYLPTIGPTPYLMSATIDGGYQFAIATVTAEAINSDTRNVDTGRLFVICEYSWDATTWFEGTYQSMFTMTPVLYDYPDAGWQFVSYITNQYMVPGTPNTCNLSVRWAIYCDLPISDYPAHNIGYSIADVSVMLDVVPRHTHVWQQVGQAADTLKSDQVDDAVELAAATPELITCTINGGAPFNITCAAPTYSNNLDIKAQLITGVNTIEFSSTVPCTVTPSANYLAFSA